MNRVRWSIVLFLSIATMFGGAAAQDKSGAAATASPEHADAQVERITVEELKLKLAKNEPVVIIDVRGKDYDQSNARIKGALRIAPGEVSARLGDIARDREVITYCACATDGGAVKAALVLLDNGFKRVRALKGGWNAWTQANGPVEPK